MKSRTRVYRQRARAKAAEQTGQDIMAAAVALWREREWDEVTLAAIASHAGVTTQTVLRRFGSKDGLVDAVLETKASGVEALRDQAPAGDPCGALDVLLTHYEDDGDAVMRMLRLEERSAATRHIAEHGRAHHRKWCARVFAPYLPEPSSADYRVRLDAFVAATDLYLWKLLRRDLGRTATQTRQVFDALIDALTKEEEASSR